MTIIYDFRQQIFNDVIWFLEHARSSNKNNTPFEYWKYCTWSIIASAIFMESYVTSHVRTIIEEIQPDNLELYEKNRFGFSENVDFVDATYGSKMRDKSNEEWRIISEVFEIRNKIVHFKEIGTWKHTTIENAEQGLIACRIFFKKLNNIIGVDSSKAVWIDKKHSENFDIPRSVKPRN